MHKKRMMKKARDEERGLAPRKRSIQTLLHSSSAHTQVQQEGGRNEQLAEEEGGGGGDVGLVVECPTNLSRKLHEGEEETYHRWIERLKFDGRDLQHVPEKLRNDKKLALAAIQQNGYAMKYAGQDLKYDKEFAMVAVQKDGRVLQHLPDLFRKDKDIVLTAIKGNPDVVKYAHEDVRRDIDVLIASGMFDETHHDATSRRHHMTKHKMKKIALSTRFSLDPDSDSEATNFTKLFKNHDFIRKNFMVYAPNAFDKNTCDPNWTDCKWPCRGTHETCLLSDKSLNSSPASDNSCWRYSFRCQLEEAKDTRGFMLQLIESGDNRYKKMEPILGNGQKIEQVMAGELNMKVFHVYRPRKHDDKSGFEMEFETCHIDEVIAAINDWYDTGCKDMSVCIIRPKYEVPIDKDKIVATVSKYPEVIQLAPDNLKRDPDVLAAAGVPYPFIHRWPNKTKTKRIILSSLFSLNFSNISQVSSFQKLLKGLDCIGTGAKFRFVYAPKAIDKSPCDPNWDNPCHPYRGTGDTCHHDINCWRFSSRQHSGQTNESDNGFTLQLDRHSLPLMPSHGARLLQDIAQDLKIKIFTIYSPVLDGDRIVRRKYGWYDIEKIFTSIKTLYDEGCHDVRVRFQYIGTAIYCNVAIYCHDNFQDIFSCEKSDKDILLKV